jgi:hypothetical protein
MAILSLDAPQNKVLDQIQAKITAIVTAGNRAGLEATGVLGPPAANQQAYQLFWTRFQLLPARLTQLRTTGEVVINTGLPSSMWADSPTADVPGRPEVSIHVRPDLVASDSLVSLAFRAVRLMHELSHTLYEDPDFTVKDFTYGSSWGQGYLPAAVGAANADTYAEAAAKLAGDLERTPGRFGEGDRIPAQRRTLHGLQPALILGPALAWADIKINRAWLRSLNYQSFAQLTAGASGWPAAAAEWTAANGNYARLLRIEAGLRDTMDRIIGDRDGFPTIGLNDASKQTAGNISRHMGALKKAVGTLKPNLTDDGQAITYTPGTDTLDVPRTLATGTSHALGELIVDALLLALPYDGSGDRSAAKFEARKRAVVDLLASQDRPYEARQMPAIAGVFQGIQCVAPPTQAAWGGARIDLDLATVRGIADRIGRNMYNAEDATAPSSTQHERGQLNTLDQALQPLIDEAITIGRRYPAPLGPAFSAAQVQAWKHDFGAVIGSLTRISAAATAFSVARKPIYDRWLATLGLFVA